MLAQCPALLWHTQYVGLLKNKNNSNEKDSIKLIFILTTEGMFEPVLDLQTIGMHQGFFFCLYLTSCLKADTN